MSLSILVSAAILTTAISKPRVLFLNRSYYPDAEATGQLLTQLCEDLSLQFDVRVIAGQPNANPADAAFVRVGEETRCGVAIRRVWNTRFSKSSALGRLANWFSYLLAATWAAMTGPRPDVIVVETDPPFLCLLGALLKRRFACRFVVYLQDIYPDLGIALGKLRGGRCTRLLRHLFLQVYRRADRVIVLSDDMQQLLTEAGVDPRKITKIANWVDCCHVKPVKEDNSFRHELELQEKFIVMHSGNVGFCQSLENVLDAAERLRERQDIAFVIVGDGAARKPLEADARRRELTNVRFVGYQPAARLAESLSAADLHLVSVDPRVIRFLMPSKLYGVLASGTPLIAIAPRECELSRLVEQQGVGYVVPPDAPQSLAHTIERLSGRPYHFGGMGRKSRQLALRCFDRRISVDAFATLLCAVSDPCELRQHSESYPFEPADSVRQAPPVRDGRALAPAAFAGRNG